MSEPRCAKCNTPNNDTPERNWHLFQHGHDFVSPEPEVGQGAMCPACLARNEHEAGKMCCGNDSCPMEQKQFLNRWPSQAEFDAHEKLQAEIADLQVAEPVAPEANMVTNVTMTIYGAEPAAPEAKPEPLRCKRTGNLCGSDTWMTGCTCPCENCQAYLRAEPASQPGEFPESALSEASKLPEWEWWFSHTSEQRKEMVAQLHRMHTAQPGEFMSAEEFWQKWGDENPNVGDNWRAVAIIFAEAYHRAALDHEQRR